MKKQCLAAVLTAWLSLPILAATTKVATVADLISAVQNAKNTDEIVIMASGSPYEFTSDQKDLVAHLYARVTIILRGETGNPEDVVLVGNQNRILYLTINGNTIRDLTFKNGDCSGYTARGDAEPYDQLRGGAICLKSDNDSTTVISNCVFLSCRSKSGGGACGTYSLNKTGGKYYDCLFDGNATLSTGGGALYRAKLVNGCTFRNNYSAASNGGALFGVPDVTGCSIVSNATSSTGGFGGGVFGCTLTGCYVASNYAYRCGAAADSNFYSCTNEANSAGDYCEFGRSSATTGCFAESCRFVNVGNSNKKIFGASGFNCCRFDKDSFVSGSYAFAQWVAMTNCLIANNSGFRFFEGLVSASMLVNCTIASNSYTFAAVNSVYNPLITVRNSFFCGNNDGVDIPAVATNLVESFNSSILSAASDDHILGSGNYNYYSERTTFKPGFVGAAVNPTNPYAISRRSLAYRKAVSGEGWMASATDIRGDGFPRLRDGMAHIGCYQCWDEIPGLSITIR
jgi:hypothetical protein